MLIESNEPIELNDLSSAIFRAYTDMENPPYQYHKTTLRAEKNGKTIITFNKPLSGCDLLENYKHEQWQIKYFYNYILQNYGWETALEFCKNKHWSEQLKKYNITINRVPHCKYSIDNQCDMFCEFYRGDSCEWAED